jgi:hypothetical protein
MLPGGVYVGIVKSVLQNGTVNVFIPRLGINYGPLRIANQSIFSTIQPEQQVVCAFLNSGVTEIVVISTLDANPVVMRGSYLLDESTDIYVTPLNSHQVMKFSLLFSRPETNPESALYKEVTVLTGDSVISSAKTVELGPEEDYGDVLIWARIDKGNLYISCQIDPAPSITTNVVATRLLAL